MRYACNPVIAFYAIVFIAGNAMTVPMANNRIKELRAARGLTQTELGEKVGVHWQTIQRLESGATELTVTWMERLRGPLEVQSITEFLEPAPRLRMVEVRGYVQAGHWAEAWEIPEGDRIEVPVSDDPALRGLSLYAVETRGPSMDQVYPEGTVVIFTDVVERGEQMVPNRRYIVERERADGLREATVKKFWRSPDGAAWLVPESSDPRFQEPIPIAGAEGDTIRVIGRVVGSFRREA